MRKYLSKKEVLNWPVGKEFKKKSIGGAIIFRKNVLNRFGKSIVYEEYSKNGVWSIEKKEAIRLLKLFGFKKVSCSVQKINKKAFVANAIANNSIIVKARAFASPNSVKEQALHDSLNKIAKNRAIVKLAVKFLRLKHLPLDTSNFKQHINPRKINLNYEKYLELYSDYNDPEELGYYDKDSPERIRIDNILKEIFPKAIVLDIGCNSGGIAKEIIALNCKVFGIDINKKLLKKAKKKGIITKTAFAEAIPFENNFFDIVIASYVLEHVINPLKVVKECKRVLKNKGKIIGTVPTEMGDWGKHNYKIHPEHLRYYNKYKLYKLLNRNGFKKIRIKKEFHKNRAIADSYNFAAIK